MFYDYLYRRRFHFGRHSNTRIIQGKVWDNIVCQRQLLWQLAANMVSNIIAAERTRALRAILYYYPGERTFLNYSYILIFFLSF
jgi:hypothetical protein